MAAVPTRIPDQLSQGHDESGKRKQLTRTFDRQKDARNELSRICHQTGAGLSPPATALRMRAVTYAAPKPNLMRGFWERVRVRGPPQRWRPPCASFLAERRGSLPRQGITRATAS